VSLHLEGFMSLLSLKGDRFRSQAYCLETLNNARIWLSKTSIIQRVLFSLLYMQVRNNQNRLENSQKFKKNSTWKWWRYFQENFRHNARIWKYWVSVTMFKSWPRNFWWSLGLKVLISHLSQRILPWPHNWYHLSCMINSRF